MTTPEYGVTPSGFNAKRLIDVKNQLDQLFISEFGDVNLDAQTVVGQIIGIFSKVFTDIWENEEDVYLSQYPNSASGISLDNVVALNGITRLQAERTAVIGVATGNENTLIPQGSLARIPATNAIFYSAFNSFITSSNAVRSVVQVLNASPQEYTILIDGISYKYSQPIINFSGPLILGNAITIRLNGVNLSPVSYVTSSNNTLNLIKAQLEAQSSVFSATIIGNSISIIPVTGQSVTINSVLITGGGPTYSQSFATPASTTNIALYLSALVDQNTKVTATSNASSITITAIDTANAYSIIVGTNLQITSTSSPILFLSSSFGPIPAPANSLTQILTPIAGWTSLTNYQAGLTGRNIETDTELRLRRLNSLRVQGTATVEAIRARLLQDVPGVSSVTIFENVTMTQSEINVTFSIDFVMGNTIEVIADGLSIGTIPYTTDQITTMNLLANLIKNEPEIDLVTVAGIGNRELEISIKQNETIVLSFNLAGGATTPTYTLSGGRPPKSFEAVVVGGTDQTVALKIWQTKPAGIETYGNTSVIILDSQGNNQLIKFSRAIPVYMYAKMNITLNPQQTFPSNGFQLIQEAILQYGNSLGIGMDVILQQLESRAFIVPGVASATAQIAKVYNLSDTPVYVSTDIDISSTEISAWDLSRIEVTV